MKDSLCVSMCKKCLGETRQVQMAEAMMCMERSMTLSIVHAELHHLMLGVKGGSNAAVTV